MNVLNIVAHNLPAMYTDRQLGLVTGEKAKSSEKLASGYKINRAADDAAGLSISEKMRKRIRGLNQGADNLQDGVSLCQTADGALMEVEDMIHRMNELAIKAANGTNSQSDRQDINDEITQLKDEMTRVFNTTKFNEIYIFKAPYVPDVVGQPNDYELYNGPDGSTPAGVLINHKRYSWDELGVPAVAEGEDWIKEITDPDNPDELIRLKLNAGDSRENLHRVYVMTADETGIMVNNQYGGLWDSTIRENGNNFSFTYHGMDISIEAESGSRTDIIDRLRKDPLMETSWDAIPITGNGNKAVSSTSDSMKYNVTNSNKNEIGTWAFEIQADAEGVGLVQTSGSDGLTHTKTKWEDFSNVADGSYPISDWGIDDEGNPITLDSSATYNYTDVTSAFLPDGMKFDFSFKENEVARAQAINGLNQGLRGGTVEAPIANVSGNTGITVTGHSGLSNFTLQRDKLLRDFGDAGAATPMTLDVERTTVKDGTVTDYENRLELSGTYVKRMKVVSERVECNYSGYTETSTAFDLDGNIMTIPEGAYYDDTPLPDWTEDESTTGPSLFSYTVNKYAADNNNSFTTTNSENEGWFAKRVGRDVYDASDNKIGKVYIMFGYNKIKKTSETYYNETTSAGTNQLYLKNGDGTYSATNTSNLYVMDTNGGSIDTDGDKYRAADDNDTSQRYISTGSAYIAVKDYEYDHYEYSGKNSGGEEVMSYNGSGTKFLKTEGTDQYITITNNDGSTTRYWTDKNSALKSATLSGYGASIRLNYTDGYGNRSNTVTITPSGPATRTFTKSAVTGGSSTDTQLIVKVNPPLKKLELQATDVNLESEREILEWTPLSNSILGLSNANTKTIASARATISSIEGALQILNLDRSVFGAYQNRLEHAIKINDNTSENTQAAESLIRDTDMASEMVKNSKQNILQQAGLSMLAQADQSNQGVLSLLQ